MKVPTPCGADGPGAEGSAPLPAALRGGAVGRLQRALLHWYGERARPLSIRTTRDPWAVLVAEVMAQQTQIWRVDDAWARFMERFPTPGTLAEASAAEVLRAWSGLGYNRRAINLQRAAAVIVSGYGGRVPEDPAALQRLPGVGAYTSRAVAAIAFGRPVAAIDTNVRRVIGRLLGEEQADREIQVVADALVPRRQAAAWTHATMDLGATICRAGRAECDRCPVARWCASAGRVPVRETVRKTRSNGDAAVTGRSAPPFEQTTRWLRGRIVARLRELEDGAWERLPPTMGGHGPEQIDAAIEALEREGLLERRADGAVRLPSVST